MSLSEAHLEILRHSTGLSRTKTPYRNHFVAGVGHADLSLIEDLIAGGFMRLSHFINAGRDAVYVVTQSGFDALGVKEPPSAA